MSPQKIAETRKALFLLGFSLLSIFRFGREFFSRVRHCPPQNLSL